MNRIQGTLGVTRYPEMLLRPEELRLGPTPHTAPRAMHSEASKV